MNLQQTALAAVERGVLLLSPALARERPGPHRPAATDLKDCRFPGYIRHRGVRSFTPVGDFLMELYVSQRDSARVRHWESCARRAAAELAGQEIAVRFVRSIFVPDDETCFLLWQADDAEGVVEAARLAALPYERLSAAQPTPEDPEAAPDLAGDTG